VNASLSPDGRVAKVEATGMREGFFPGANKFHGAETEFCFACSFLRVELLARSTDIFVGIVYSFHVFTKLVRN
jgi:hypothetical protein